MSRFLYALLLLVPLIAMGCGGVEEVKPDTEAPPIRPEDEATMKEHMEDMRKMYQNQKPGKR